MKMNLIFASLITVLLFGCSSHNHKPDIAGIYTLQFKNEFSIASDTLIITSYSAEDQIFSVDFRAGFNKIRDGVVKPREFDRKQWKATWDKDKRLLIENEPFGRQLKFPSNKPVLLNGNTEYQKIK